MIIKGADCGIASQTRFYHLKCFVHFIPLYETIQAKQSDLCKENSAPTQTSQFFQEF